MKIRLRTNLGTIHAQAIGLCAAECLAGTELDVGDDSGDWLVKQRKADEVMVAVPPEPMKAVPPARMPAEQSNVKPVLNVKKAKSDDASE